MCPSPSNGRVAPPRTRGRSVLAACALALLLPRPAAAATARFEVSGTTRTVDPALLEVVVHLKNAGDAAAQPLQVEGELFEEHSRMRLDRGIRPGETDHVVLQFPLVGARPGRHALVLLAEWPGPGPQDNAALPAMASQRLFLLLNLGAAAEPAVRLLAPELTLETEGRLEVGLESADGAAHRVLLRAHPPRGLNAFGPPIEVAVPAQGRTVAELALLRAGAPRGSRQGVLVHAQALDGERERAEVAATVVQIAPDPALLPKLRPALWTMSALLIAASLWLALRPPRG